MQRNTVGGGFGLIELLLVIAVIGILTGLVISSTEQSRLKSEDVRIKSGIRQLRVVAESYFNANSNSYTGFDTCAEAPTPAACQEQQLSDNVASLRADMEDAYGSADIIDASANSTQFCVAAPLRIAASTYVCADDSGEVQDGVSAASPCAGATPACTFS